MRSISHEVLRITTSLLPLLDWSNQHRLPDLSPNPVIADQLKFISPLRQLLRLANRTQHYFKTFLQCRDAFCVLTGKMVTSCHAAHLVPYSRPDVSSFLLPHSLFR